MEREQIYKQWLKLEEEKERHDLERFKLWEEQDKLEQLDGEFVEWKGKTHNPMNYAQWYLWNKILNRLKMNGASPEEIELVEKILR